MYKAIKRFFDILFSLVAIIILLPIFIPVIILLLLTGKHEVFFRQDRVCYKNKNFRIWQFPTILKNSPNMRHEYVSYGMVCFFPKKQIGLQNFPIASQKKHLTRIQKLYYN